MIYQMADTALNPRMSIGEIIARPVQFYLGLTGKAKRARVDALLDQIELEPSEYYNRLPSELSGGQQQRVAIVRALAMRPEVMLFDEITSALDPQLVGEVLDVLLMLKNQGMTMVLATHEMGFAREAADKVCFLQSGRIIEEGPPEAVFDAPQRPETQAFLARALK
jgi:polar amino acid transport system ATP-binding protein